MFAPQSWSELLNERWINSPLDRELLTARYVTRTAQELGTAHDVLERVRCGFMSDVQQYLDGGCGAVAGCCDEDE